MIFSEIKFAIKNLLNVNEYFLSKAKSFSLGAIKYMQIYEHCPGY